MTPNCTCPPIVNNKNIIMKVEKKYRSLQVEFAPGIYAGFVMLGLLVAVTTGNLLYMAVMWLWIFFVYYKDKPLRYIFSKNILYKWIFILFIVFVNIIVGIFSVMGGSDLTELFVMILIPVSAIFIFLFLVKIYTHEKLVAYGWKNISGRFN